MRSRTRTPAVIVGLLAVSSVLTSRDSRTVAPNATVYSKYSYLLTGNYQNDCGPNFNYPSGWLVGGEERLDSSRSGTITCYYQ